MSIWGTGRLHTKLYKVAWNVSANNSETVRHTDMRLGEVVYILDFYNIYFLGFFYFMVLNLLFFMAWQWKRFILNAQREMSELVKNIWPQWVKNILPQKSNILPQPKNILTARIARDPKTSFSAIGKETYFSLHSPNLFCLNWMRSKKPKSAINSEEKPFYLRLVSLEISSHARKNYLHFED